MEDRENAALVYTRKTDKLVDKSSQIRKNDTLDAVKETKKFVELRGEAPQRQPKRPEDTLPPNLRIPPDKKPAKQKTSITDVAKNHWITSIITAAHEGKLTERSLSVDEDVSKKSSRGLVNLNNGAMRDVSFSVSSRFSPAAGKSSDLSGSLQGPAFLRLQDQRRNIPVQEAEDYNKKYFYLSSIAILITITFVYFIIKD